MRSKPVTADYVHSGIFVPVSEDSPDIHRFTFSPMGNPATKLLYWDQEAWASELMLSDCSSAINELNSKRPWPGDIVAAPVESEDLAKLVTDPEGGLKKRKIEAKEVTKQKKVARWCNLLQLTDLTQARLLLRIFNSGVTVTQSSTA